MIPDTVRQDVRAGLAKMLHTLAFAELVEDPDPDADQELKAAIAGFNPGPGGNWMGTVPETPPAAFALADLVLARVGDAPIEWIAKFDETRALAFGQDLALSVLGTGAGLHDGDWDGEEDLPDVPILDDALSFHADRDGDGTWTIRAGSSCFHEFNEPVWNVKTGRGLHRIEVSK